MGEINQEEQGEREASTESWTMTVFVELVKGGQGRDVDNVEK